MLVWSQLTCVIRPGLAPMPGQSRVRNPACVRCQPFCPFSTFVPRGHEWETFPTPRSYVWSNLFLKELPKWSPQASREAPSGASPPAVYTYVPRKAHWIELTPNSRKCSGKCIIPISRGATELKEPSFVRLQTQAPHHHVFSAPPPGSSQGISSPSVPTPAQVG